MTKEQFIIEIKERLWHYTSRIGIESSINEYGRWINRMYAMKTVVFDNKSEYFVWCLNESKA